MLPLSTLNSPTPSAASRLSDGSRHSDSHSVAFSRNRSVPEFQIERPKQSNGGSKRPAVRRMQSDYGAENSLRVSISRMIAAKARPFTASGHIPLDPTALVLFFRSKVRSLSRPTSQHEASPVDFRVALPIRSIFPSMSITTLRLL